MDDDLKPKFGFDPDPVPPYMRLGPPRGRQRKRVCFVPLTGSSRYVKVDACDYYRTAQLKWHLNAQGYPVTRRARAMGGDGRKVTLHMFILGRRDGKVIDHLDGDKCNGTRSNLRHRPISENLFNVVAYRNSRSGLRGVFPVQTKCRKYWRVQLGIRYKMLTMGESDQKEEAGQIANLGIALMYGRGRRLHNGEPFAESHIASLVAGAAGISPRNLRRLLETTAPYGDELSAELRRQLVERYAPPSE